MWKDPDLPTGVAAHGRLIAIKNGLLYKTALPGQTLAKVSRVDELLSILPMTREDVKAAAEQNSFLGLLLVDADGTLHFLILWCSGESDLDHLVPLPVTTVAPTTRIPIESQWSV